VRTRLRAVEVNDKDPCRAGTVHVAPPGYHLLVERGATLALSIDDAVTFARPSIDVLLESAAWALGPGVLAIVLSGASRDGAAGVAAVRAHGGRVWVQDPATAAFATMPSAALDHADVVLPPERMGAVLAAWAVGAPGRSPDGGAPADRT
jgi:two-component system chemotaxis response regulator CheB